MKMNSINKVLLLNNLNKLVVIINFIIILQAVYISHKIIDKYRTLIIILIVPAFVTGNIKITNIKTL